MKTTSVLFSAFSTRRATVAIAANLLFLAGGATGQNVFPAAGNVGIGTTTPSTSLEVVRSSFLISKFKNSATTGDRTALIDVENGQGVLWRYGVGGLGNGIGITNGQFYLERLGIGAVLAASTTGNVGIGTINPLTKLQVEGGNISQVSAGALGAPAAKFLALGTPPAAFPTGGNYYGLFQNWAQQNFVAGLLDNGTKKDGLIAWQDQTSTSVTAGTRLRLGFIKGFGTGGANPAVFSEKATVLANGNVGIGTAAPGFQLELSLNSAAKPGGGSWAVPSDARLKTNVRPFTDGLAVLEKINPVWFAYNGKAGLPAGQQFVGTEAQALREAAPYMVGSFAHATEDGAAETYLSADYSALTFVLLNAVKEQQRLLTARDARLKVLEDKLLAMEKGGKASSSAAAAAARGLALEQNVPNPASEQTVIAFEVPAAAQNAVLYVYDLQGNPLKQVPIAQRGKGSIVIKAGELRPGHYVYTLVADGQASDSKHMILTQ